MTGTVVRQHGIGLIRQNTTKGKKGRGHLIPAFAVAMLKRRAEAPSDSGFVFTTPDGALRATTTVAMQFRAFGQRHSEWAWITPHVFRKSVATAVERGADLAAAAAQLGHARTSVTAKHYVAMPAVGPDQRAILERFGEEPRRSK